MTLIAGQRLGPYEILGSLGAGGMGEVYRARDSKLQRDVAIKVLPDSLATDRERLARFEREAQLLAALNHPHIAAIYGVDASGETQFLVLELVDGDTLAERIARGGALALSEALAIARQIADALQAAHDKGIIHRDLKPANIALTADGHVKVLDFGLAKALDVAPAASTAPAATLSPTLSLAMTEAGFILGTAAYMSPEQAKGRPADKRSDVWAFGCVLFEMLTGKRAFEGEDASDTLAGILRGEPDWKALPRSTPPHVREVLTGCLAKDRKQRLADIAVVNYLLAAPSHVQPKSTSKLSRAIGIAAAALLLIAVAAGVVWLRGGGADTPAPVKRFSIVPPFQQGVSNTTNDRQLVISPDGLHIVYVAAPGQLALRHLDRIDAQMLTGTTNARVPFWSPDSKWIGFTLANLELRKVSVTGGPSAVITRVAAPPRGATWGDDDNIVFATADTATGLSVVPAGGGEPRVLTRPDTARGEIDHVFPSAVPGGRTVLFTILTRANTADSAQIAALDMRSGEYKVLLAGGSNPEYIAPGYIVYAAAGVLRAVRFEAERGELIGDPVPVLDQVAMPGVGVAQYSVARNGDLVYIPGTANVSGTGRMLVWVDRSGKETPVPGIRPRAYQYPRLSRDNSRVAVTIADQEQDIHVFHFGRQTLTQITFGPAVDSQATWLPDNERILFSSTRAGPANLFLQRADGAGQTQRITESTANQLTTTMSPDGKVVVLLEQHGATGNDLAVLRLDTRLESAATLPAAGSRPPDLKLKTEPFINSNYTEAHPELSPDGRYLAHLSNDTGQQQVYVVPFPDRNGRWLISQDGGTRPVWNPNGKELIYAAPSGAIMAVPVLQTTPTFVAGNPVKLFDWPTIGTPGLARTYDIAADGRRFLMIKEPGSDGRDASPPTILVVLNWLSELKSKVPAK